ncbi:hypothetical protein OROGR_019312 [Orobanche gracilis]
MEFFITLIPIKRYCPFDMKIEAGIPSEHTHTRTPSFHFSQTLWSEVECSRRIPNSDNRSPRNEMQKMMQNMISSNSKLTTKPHIRRPTPLPFYRPTLPLYRAIPSIRFTISALSKSDSDARELVNVIPHITDSKVEEDPKSNVEGPVTLEDIVKSFILKILIPILLLLFVSFSKNIPRLTNAIGYIFIIICFLTSTRNFVISLWNAQDPERKALLKGTFNEIWESVKLRVTLPELLELAMKTVLGTFWVGLGKKM